MTTFTASYTINGAGNSIAIDTNGETLNQVIVDMVDFWNEADNSRKDFQEIENSMIDDYSRKAIVEGTCYGEIDGVMTADIVDTITIEIIAEIEA